jgi:threonine/homoserine/homoserine lactone efflux protein
MLVGNEINLLIQGIVIGFSIAAPVGPIGVLCIRRTLAEGRVPGLVSGLGAATADAIYGCIAGFGLTFISNLLIDRQTWIRFVGGLFLCYLGIKTFFAPASDRAAPSRGNGLIGAYGSTFFLTLTNPMTILSFVAIFAGLNVASAGGQYHLALLLVLGVFGGSCLWWFLLSALASVLRARLNARVLQWVNRISGIVVTVFGLVALASVISATG